MGFTPHPTPTVSWAKMIQKELLQWFCCSKWNIFAQGAAKTGKQLFPQSNFYKQLAMEALPLCHHSKPIWGFFFKKKIIINHFLQLLNGCGESLKPVTFSLAPRQETSIPKPEKVPQGLAVQQIKVEWYLRAGDWDKKREEILFSVRSRVLHDPPLNPRRKIQALSKRTQLSGMGHFSKGCSI